ncbi:hypothetical protein BSR29_04875 [Boudabousia liubingyangii]|uniref:Glycine zipper family protein n=1 Tax=Boudabousia liubingyangii TaxID=1921764 RepID=A0A1Q5PLA0_9ACTO|nr:hypothetical protein [Boudabousia liubingyangii]OKL47829.1 hypothetical protein BSR29_04875 [Boudabousia liubingyangii]
MPLDIITNLIGIILLVPLIVVSAKTNKQRKEGTLTTRIQEGMSVGMLIGILAGFAFDQLALGAGIGGAIGTLIGMNIKR